MPITHAFTSAKADGGDATLIRPSDWNADHEGLEGLYAAGTDRFCITTEYLAYDPQGGGIGVDWRGVDGGTAAAPGPPRDPFVTRIGDLFDLDHLETTGELKFVVAGVYDVRVHFAGGIGANASVSLVLPNEAADGSDVYNVTAATAGPNLGYAWAHAIDDVVTAELEFPSAPGVVTFNVVCQVVKLSNVAPPADEFDPAYSGDLSELTP